MQTASINSNAAMLKFEPLQSSVDVTFWPALRKLVLDRGLASEPVNITGAFASQPGQPARLTTGGFSLGTER